MTRRQRFRITIDSTSSGHRRQLPPGTGSATASGGVDAADLRRRNSVATASAPGSAERVQLNGDLITRPTGRGSWRVEARLPAPPAKDERHEHPGGLADDQAVVRPGSAPSWRPRPTSP